MDAKLLYQQLEKDFITPKLSDDWAQYMDSIKDFLSENFRKRSMGLVCDFAKDIKEVYTAVFPSDNIMQTILDKGTEDAMLFVHHPSVWDIKDPKGVFHNMDKTLLQKFKEKKISIYNLHVPLDNFSKYSTSVTLAKVLRIKERTPFAPYFGGLAGVFGKTDHPTVRDLKQSFESAIGHKARLYEYGDDVIKNSSVAVVGGGGNDLDILKEIEEKKVNILVTGVTANSDYSKKAHEFAEKNQINILGGTHYSTEKFACIAMCEYFKKIDLHSKFIEDVPMMDDL